MMLEKKSRNLSSLPQMYEWRFSFWFLDLLMMMFFSLF